MTAGLCLLEFDLVLLVRGELPDRLAQQPCLVERSTSRDDGAAHVRVIVRLVPDFELVEAGVEQQPPALPANVADALHGFFLKCLRDDRELLDPLEAVSVIGLVQLAANEFRDAGDCDVVFRLVHFCFLHAGGVGTSAS